MMYEKFLEETLTFNLSSIFFWYKNNHIMFAFYAFILTVIFVLNMIVLLSIFIVYHRRLQDY